jgi:preprotein translocase subunit SecA
VLRRCRDVVSRVNGLEPSMTALADDALRALTGSFRERLGRGEPLSDLLPEAFAAVREAAVRTLGQRPFDVQVMGGAVLQLGQVAEMKTGEGKTLTATMPAYLSALAGHGVHVMTANDYLAGRDAEWMGPVYRFLGLTTGLILAQPRPSPVERRQQYLADVTYGEAHQFGYDYLRDDLAWYRDDLVQRGQHCALVDEADLILIDEMRSPMQISRPAGQAKTWHREVAALAARLERDVDYEIDERNRTATLTENGSRVVAAHVGVSNLYAAANLTLAHHMGKAIEAKECYQRDRDYIRTGDQVVLIDQASGRPLPDRRYENGLHEALEAKEGVPVRAEQQPLAMITMWEYLGRYQHLAGMTGTAQPDAAAYRQIYQRDVVTIPTNKPVIRVDHGDVVYRTQASKLAGLTQEAATRHQAGQPVLIGASSIAESDTISALLTGRGIAHQTLTARNHEYEARILAGAGQLGAVTVVARMAGRGVDIVLGGPDGAGREAVADLGGLCVLGTERPARRRLEMHLRGRAGRQGDPGEAEFFLSYDDELVKAAGQVTARLASRFLPDGQHNRQLSELVTSIQASAAASDAARLVQTREFDRVLADQRRVIDTQRAPAARGQDMGEWVQQLISDVLQDQVTSASGAGLQAEQFWAGLRELYPAEWVLRHADPVIARAALPRIAEEAVADAQQIYLRHEAELGVLVSRELERRVILSLLDRGWRDHLQAMAELLSTISSRTTGEAALAEYRRQGSAAFSQLRRAVNRDIVRTLFYIRMDPAAFAHRD